MNTPRGRSLNSAEDQQLWVADYMVARVLDRIYYITLFMSGLFAIYGLVSIDFIRAFSPETSLFSNVWPRIAFNSLPLLVLARYIRFSAANAHRKVIFWLVSFILIFDTACMINVWPIAWGHKADIMLYVNAANNCVFFAVGIVLAFAFRKLYVPLSIIGALFWTPLFVVVHHAGDVTILKAIMNDALFLGITGLLFGAGFNKAEERLARLELEKQLTASLFLGPMISRAVFENDRSAFHKKTVRGFIVSIDVRDSTTYLHKYHDDWLTFRNKYFTLVSSSVAENGGHIQKTMGDGHIINFGIMEGGPDLSHIPGLEHEERLAEERRLRHFSDKVFNCLEEIFEGFHRLAATHFPNESLRIGAGIDKGVVERAIQSHGSMALELDVNGDPVNCSSRLQDYSKWLQGQFSQEESLLLVSPFASDYLPDFTKFRKVATVEYPIRDYPDIKWVLVRVFKQRKLSGLRHRHGVA